MGWVVFLARFLVGAALLEFLFLRFVLRLGPVLPSGDTVTTVLSWVGQAGLLFLNVSVIAGLALLALVLVVLPRESRRASAAPLWAAAALALGVSVVRLAGPYVSDLTRDPGFLIALNAVSMLTVLLIAASGLTTRRGLLPLTVLTVTYGAALLHYTAGIAPAVGAPGWGRGTSLALAEALLLLMGPAVLWTLRPSWRPRAALAAAAIAAIYLALATVRPWIASALAIWDFGFTSFLPAYIYALALWALVYAVLALAREGQRGALASTALALVALGGLRLDYAHYSILALVGMLLLAVALTESRQTRRSVAGLGARTPWPSTSPVERAVGASNTTTP
ncbi:MAG: hypothetical protein Q8O40_08795 [Chloroflexota bacterium]|nr:hypothetical protein [Chloroflexota bacterium]